MSALTTTWVAVVAGTTVSICAPALALTDEEIAESDRLLQAGEFQSAEALYRRAFERDPADAQAALRLIYSLIVQARTDEAAAYMDHMIARDYRYLSEYVSPYRPAAQNLIDTYMIDADMRARAERLVTTAINRVH